MTMKACIADPAHDLFIESATGEPARSFLCEDCEPAASIPATTHVVVDDGFNRWQRCGACGELIYTTQLVAA